MSIFSKVLGFLLGGGISAIGEQIRLARKAELEAKNDSDRIDAELVVKQLEARRSVLIEEIKSDRTWWIRPAIAFPIVVYINKIIIYDKVLKLGVTDDLSPDMWKLFWIVVGFYFLTRGGEYIMARKK